jgi:hypothetical protein
VFNFFISRQLESSRSHRVTLTMKVRIKEWHAVATWRWDMPEDEVCGICRVQFDGTCPTCKYPGDDCSLRMVPLPYGMCLHSRALAERALP